MNYNTYLLLITHINLPKWHPLVRHRSQDILSYAMMLPPKRLTPRMNTIRLAGSINESNDQPVGS